MADTLSRIMTRHHQHCDDLFVALESQVQRGDWRQALPSWEALHHGIERHFDAEEGWLFPAFEALAGHTNGPTEVMRQEHAQIRELLGGCRDAMNRNDADAFANLADTLLIMLQQHNAKEENVLYPLCERLLGAQGMSLAENFAVEMELQCPS